LGIGWGIITLYQKNKNVNKILHMALDLDLTDGPVMRFVNTGLNLQVPSEDWEYSAQLSNF
jgi:hypothetical protein